MKHKLTILPDKIELLIEDKLNLLSQLATNNYDVPSDCLNGTCRACKCKILHGKVSLDFKNNILLGKDEIKQGYILLCKSYAHEDVSVYLPNVSLKNQIQEFMATVINIVKYEQVAVVYFKVLHLLDFNFFSGQYVDIILNDKNRSYSIANSYNISGIVEIHVKYHVNGVFSEYVWNQLKIGDSLNCRGPLGNFKLQNSEKSVILVCTGTGIAPIKSIIESVINYNSDKMFYLYWGNKNITDFYLLDNIKQWQQFSQIKINLCVSRETHDDFYHGYVTDKIKADFNDLSNFEVYACGNKNMIQDMYNIATKDLHLPMQCFYSDAFVASL